MITGHSRLAPSSADRWVFCPASVRMAEAFPQLVEDPSAAEGTASHWAGFSMLKTHAPQPGDICPENGVQLTEEMLEGALVYNNAVFAVANKCGGLQVAELEISRAIRSIHAEMWGTPDCTVWHAESLTLYVIDYKFGHRAVDAFECWQLAGYARGKLDELQLPDESAVKIVFVIVQPRSYTRSGPVRTWETSAVHLETRMWPMMREAATEALDAVNPRFAVGAHCRDCPARRACPTLARNAQAAMDLANASMPMELSPGELGVELAFTERAYALLDARRKALQQQAEVLICNGGGVPGYALEAARGSSKWTVDVAEVRALGAMCDADLLKAPAPVTPNQARELLVKKGLDPSVIAAYSQHTPGSLQLVPAENTLAHRVFSKGNL